ncbi:YbaK/EbsC family protein [Clostridium sp. D2Q-14]|uniref:YbaK/EbsC family protein n=1 Tax=Anaeromonas gelatinilytica TaxID=2683194 RepID=UPI00193B572B|nr:YbaK/EbsC family protein [Anaeromonas gelatinilytica]MBS4534496.1 YbaK/EbsC family protein [Anaeromonas gelatinilytica]
MYEKIINILKKGKIKYSEYNHESVLDYDAAKRVRERFNLKGVESKSLFIKSKSNKYYVFVTLEEKRMNSKKIKKLIGEKISIALGEELEEITGMTPGCASPFGYSKDISMIVDKDVFKSEKFLFSPGVPEITIEIKGKDIQNIIELLDNPIIYY